MSKQSLQKILAEMPDIKLKDMLTEFRRTASPFVRMADGEWEDAKWGKLYDDLELAVIEQYRGVVNLIPGVIINPNITGEEIVPQHIKKKYLECNIYCAQFMEKRARSISRHL